MIRTVPIPKTVSRMGCAPGSGCCDSCGGHTGPPIGAPADHTHAIPGNRNRALHTALGDVLPDDPGLAQAVADWAASTNSAADQTALNALLMSGQTAPVSSATSTGPSKSTLMYIGVGLLFVFLLEATSRRR